MCEIFGVCMKERYEINDYLGEFFRHSSRHPHGWGIACMEGNEVAIEKEPVQATKSNYLKERLSMPVRVHAALAHIRYATIGNVEFCNCHPFSQKDDTGRRWTLVHNGTIFDYSSLNKYVGVQQGDTDSERILLHLVEKVNREVRNPRHGLSSGERFALIDSVFCDMSKGNKLNMLIYDGELMYVHTNYADSLYYLEKEKGVLFATSPVSGEDWQPVPFTRVLAYRDGALLYTGTNHKNEYEDSEENLKFLYQIFSNL